jgi:hypothetical protein
MFQRFFALAIAGMVAGTFTTGTVFAQQQQPQPLLQRKAPANTTRSAPPATSSSCEAKAVDSEGKPLAGAEKASFMKKCEAEVEK